MFLNAKKVLFSILGKMKDHIEKKYKCVNCGEPANELYKQYSPSVLKLTQCESCQDVVDKYIEYDGVLILIDIILFNKQAYRHVLFNTQFKNNGKLALLLLVILAYDEWLYLKKFLSDERFDYSKDIFFEKMFYFSFLVITIGKLFFFVWILTCCNVLGRSNKPQADSLLIRKAVIASSFGYFLILPSLIWQDMNRDLHLIFMAGYNLISHTQALSVVCKTSRPVLAIILAFAGVIDAVVRKYTRWWLWIS